jgi:hypothetical protein
MSMRNRLLRINFFLPFSHVSKRREIFRIIAEACLLRPHPLILTRVATFCIWRNIVCRHEKIERLPSRELLIMYVLVAGQETLYNMLCCSRRRGLMASSRRAEASATWHIQVPRQT